MNYNYLDLFIFLEEHEVKNVRLIQLIMKKRLIKRKPLIIQLELIRILYYVKCGSTTRTCTYFSIETETYSIDVVLTPLNANYV